MQLNSKTSQEIDYNWGTALMDYPNAKTLFQLFQDQVEKTPDAIALIFEGDQLTYRELNYKSNQLARSIRKRYKSQTHKDLPPDTLIALYLERGFEMIIGMMGVLKAGGAYVPIDPAYPKDRVDYIVNDTDTFLILTQNILGDKVNILPEQKLLSIDLDNDLYRVEATEDLEVYSNSRDLAYVIYTSGTTGAPKGVLVEHIGVVNLIMVQKHELDIRHSTRVLQYASYVFDASVWEIFSCLSLGATLYIVSTEIRREAELLSDFIDKQEITTALIPPVLLETLTQTKLKSIKTLLIGGDSCSADLVERWREDRMLFNAYGPTEATVYASIHRYRNKDISTNIGCAIGNTKLYVLNPQGQTVPVGEIGELYIGGAGIARGYLNNNELTNQCFVHNPFASEDDKERGYIRLYKTGDLVKWLPEGHLEYIGRKDNQVKIRGYRIELSEIEQHLLKMPWIKQSTVLVKERKTSSGLDKRLVGYYVPNTTYAFRNTSTVIDKSEQLYDGRGEREIEMPLDVVKSTDLKSNISEVTILEIEEWQNKTLAVIRNFDLTNTLEIGVGAGLLMFSLLGDVKKFTGMDFSKTVIEHHRTNRLLQKPTHNVALYHLSANQITQLPSKSTYSTIIMNSVSQNLPDIEYFEDVLEQSFDKLAPRGTLFIGDVRNYELQEAVLKERFESASQGYEDQDVDRGFLNEKALLISPKYFLGLKRKYNNINIEVKERVGDYVNALSRYRYDVIITSNSTEEGIKRKKDVRTIPSEDLYNNPYLNKYGNAFTISALHDKLPEYMIPSKLIAVRRLPLTVNGKLDKKALLDLDYIETGCYDMPTTKLEKKLCDIWKDVLGIDRVGVNDDFFKIGGNSILAIKLSHKISIALNKEVRVANLYELKSIRQIILNYDSVVNEEFINIKL